MTPDTFVSPSYFAKFLPDFPTFREKIHRIKNFPDFKRLVREHFRTVFQQ